MVGVVFWLVKIAKFAQGTMVLITDDDMVNQFEFQKLTGANQITGHFDVRLAGARLPAGVIVHEHDGARAARNGGAEHLACMDKNGVHRAC